MKNKTRMHTTLIQGIGLAIVLSIAAHNTNAQDAGKAKSPPAGGPTQAVRSETIAMDSEPGLREFVEAYIAANNAKDMKKVLGMHDPKEIEALKKAFEALKPGAPGTLTWENAVLRATVVPDHHSAFTVKRFLKDSPLPGAGFVDWPVQPTHEVQCQFEREPNHTEVYIIDLARADGHWVAVHGVPNIDAFKNMQRTKSK